MRCPELVRCNTLQVRSGQQSVWVTKWCAHADSHASPCSAPWAGATLSFTQGLLRGWRRIYIVFIISQIMSPILPVALSVGQMHAMERLRVRVRARAALLPARGCCAEDQPPNGDSDFCDFHDFCEFCCAEEQHFLPESQADRHLWQNSHSAVRQDRHGGCW